MGLIAYVVPGLSGGDLLFLAGARLGGAGSSGVFLRWILHVIVGMVFGAIFGALLSRTRRLRTLHVGMRTFGALLIGLVAWVVVFVPMLTLMPGLLSVGTPGTVLVNVIFGLVLIAVFVAGQALFIVEPDRSLLRCPVCGETFIRKERLEQHYRELHPAQKQKAQEI